MSRMFDDVPPPATPGRNPHDPLRVLLEDCPEEWDKTFDRDALSLVLSKRPANGLWSPELKAELDAIVGKHWFIIKNELRARCNACRVGRLPGAIHPYLTMACTPIPFNGLTEAIGIIERDEARDHIWEGMKFGSIVPITYDTAMRFANRISLYGGVVPGMRR